MITFNACPRCGGAVLDYGAARIDSPMCITCGWRHVEVPPDVQLEVEAHLEMDFIENPYLHQQIGTGRPPLSGWERIKRQRERDANRANASVR
jgi:hypothetical protein